MELFIEAIEPGYYVFTSSDTDDYSTASEGVYTIDSQRIVVDEYGIIISVTDLTTGQIQTLSSNCSTYVWGFDTYINRFSIKRKHSFFLENVFGLPDDTNFNYSYVPNAAYPIYYFDTDIKKEKKFFTVAGLEFPLTSVTGYAFKLLMPILRNSLFDVNQYIPQPKYILDCNTREDNDQLGFFGVDGFIYTYSYGVPSFIVESDVNVDLRQKGINLSEDFYPNQTELTEWLQEKNVPIITDNKYIYDKSYSKQLDAEYHYQYTQEFKGQKDCKTIHYNRSIYSPQDIQITNNNNADNYLINRALDYFDFSLNNGRLISIEGIEQDKVLVRQENNSSVFGAYYQLNVDAATVLLTVGNIFRSKPIEFTKPTLGYFGSQHKAILHTPYGHVSINAEQGLVFLLGNGANNLEEISRKGMKHWFKENLPFTIKKYFPEVDIDNNFAGIGIHLGYDNRFNLLYVTKLDYEPKKDITFDPLTNEFKSSEGNVISLSNKKYFNNKSWTISYNFDINKWVSFHSFTPLYYIDHIDHFDTGIEGSLWKHNITNKDYQRFYGKLEPFIIEVEHKTDLQNSVVKNVSYLVDAIQFINSYDYIYHKDKSFNRATVYNETQSSGELSLNYIENDLQKKSQYPIKKINKWEIPLGIKENIHSFNLFKDIVKSVKVPIWLYKPNNAIKNLNTVNHNYLDDRLNLASIRSLKNKVRLTQDKEYAFKFIFKGTLINDIKSNRL